MLPAVDIKYVEWRCDNWQFYGDVNYAMSYLETQTSTRNETKRLVC